MGILEISLKYLKKHLVYENFTVIGKNQWLKHLEIVA